MKDLSGQVCEDLGVLSFARVWLVVWHPYTRPTSKPELRLCPVASPSRGSSLEADRPHEVLTWIVGACSALEPVRFQSQQVLMSRTVSQALLYVEMDLLRL